MASTVSFGVVEKSINSTKQGTYPVSLLCDIKEPCSALAPELFVSISESALFGNGTLNHCYIPEFSRYYFVDDWIYERGHWKAICRVDVLASFMAWIGNSSQYILRSAAEYDGSIYDTMYPVTNQILEYPDVQFSPWVFSTAFYVVGVISPQGGSIGAVSYYAMNNAQFANFVSALFGSNYIDMTEINQDMSAETFRALFNPFQYIVSCMYIPMPIHGVVGTTINNIYIGYWNSGCDGILIQDSVMDTSLDWAWGGAHPNHTYGRYVYCAPYTELDLCFQPFGNISLQPDIFYDRGGVHIDIHVDLITGQATAYIGGFSEPVTTLQSQVGVPIQIAQVTRDFMGIGTTMAQSIGNSLKSVSSLDVGGAISNVASGIDSSIRAQIPKLQTVGSNGSFANLVSNPCLTKRYRVLVDEDNTRLGRPLCAERVISSLSGYILCENAKVDIPGTGEESQQVQHFMNSGFYYE